MRPVAAARSCMIEAPSRDADRVMKKVSYKGHVIELVSEKLRPGQWAARATVIVDEGKHPKRIPIYGRRRATFDSQQGANDYALELAKLWVEGRIWGGNGHS